MIDGVILDRSGAMAAGVRYFQTIVLEGLLCGFDFQNQTSSVCIELATGAFIQRKPGVDEFTLIFHEPPGAIERTTRLFAAGEGQLERAPRPEMLFTEADKCVSPDR